MIPLQLTVPMAFSVVAYTHKVIHTDSLSLYLQHKRTIFTPSKQSEYCVMIKHLLCAHSDRVLYVKLVHLKYIRLGNART